jgi:hypothetical protein
MRIFARSNTHEHFVNIFRCHPDHDPDAIERSGDQLIAFSDRRRRTRRRRSRRQQIAGEPDLGISSFKQFERCAVRFDRAAVRRLTFGIFVSSLERRVSSSRDPRLMV